MAKGISRAEVMSNSKQKKNQARIVELREFEGINQSGS